MTQRITRICEQLSPCECFADVGCDHGFCARYMLDNKLCKSAIITDISAKSLSKAENLLQKYIKSGICRSVCCDGLEGVPQGSADLVLIAGMGGEEIIKILKNAYIPQNFVFQPMKNAEELREYLLNSGCAFEYDGIFTEKRGGECKHYFLIKGRRQGAQKPYSRAELAFGRDSLGTRQLCAFLNSKLEKNRLYLLSELSEESRNKINERIKFMKGVISGEIK